MAIENCHVLIVDLPIQKSDFPVRYVSLPEGMVCYMLWTIEMLWCRQIPSSGLQQKYPTTTLVRNCLSHISGAYCDVHQSNGGSIKDVWSNRSENHDGRQVFETDDIP